MFERAVLFATFLVFISFCIGFHKFHQLMNFQAESPVSVIKEIFSAID